MTQGEAGAEEGERPRSVDTPRERQKRVGKNISTTAYNQLVTELQKPAPDLGRALHLSRIVESGCRIEREADLLPLAYEPVPPLPDMPAGD